MASQKTLQKKAEDPNPDARLEVDPGASRVEPAPVEPGEGVDPVAREVPPPDYGKEALELADALAALEQGAGGIIQFHASKPVVNPDRLGELKELLDRVNKAYKAL